ncbi:MAG: hypothetical protein F4X82_03350, partial [Candidatus Spechtbacteria bacterium SB0662_bin_43]|nr:hypothetical protein [Candidatus Spechtbacteria bacterium SB0662_bin_43]
MYSIFKKKGQTKKYTIAIGILLLIAILCVLLYAFVINTVEDKDGSITSDSAIEPSRIALTPDQDSEQLLYNDEFMDEAIQTYTLRSLTSSLDRVASQRGLNCHNRAHELGRRAYELLGNEAFKECGIECHSGCRHGATEAFFAHNGSGNLAHSIDLLCGEETAEFGLHQCLHGTGHGLMAWFDYDIHAALEACDLIETNHRSSCRSGVFMENIVGGIATAESTDGDEYHFTKYLNDDPHYPCNILDDTYKSDCYFLQTDRIQTLLGREAIGAECAKIEKPFQLSCFLSMGRTISGSTQQNPEEAFTLCRTTIEDPENANICLSGVLADLIWDETHTDRAIAFCALDHYPSFRGKCYHQLMSIAASVIPSHKRDTFCKQLPEQYHDTCISQKATAAAPLKVTDTVDTPTTPTTQNATIRYIDGEYIPDTVHISLG